MFLALVDTMGAMDIRETLRSNLEALMADRGIPSQLQLSKLSGVSQSMIGSIMRAERDTTTGTLLRLAKALQAEGWALLVNPDSLDAAIAPGASELLAAYASLDEAGRKLVLNVAQAQAALAKQSAA